MIKMTPTRDLGTLIMEANEAFFSAPLVTQVKNYNNGVRARRMVKEGEAWYKGCQQKGNQLVTRTGGLKV